MKTFKILAATFVLCINLGTANANSDILSYLDKNKILEYVATEELKLGPTPEPLKTEILADTLDRRTGRIVQRLKLVGQQSKEIYITISFPGDFEQNPERKYPVLALFAGAETGQNSIDYLVGHLPNDNQAISQALNQVIFLSYEYPIKISNLSDLGETSKLVPIQMATLIGWVGRQSWADPFRINTMGVSFGAITLPMAQALAQYQGTVVNATVFAYGGGHLVSKIAKDLKLGEKESRVLSALLVVPSALFEPVVYLPILRGKFLVVSGSEDQIISAESAEAFRNAVPIPKTEVQLDGPHIDSDQPDIIGRLATEVFAWLSQVGAL